MIATLPHPERLALLSRNTAGLGYLPSPFSTRKQASELFKAMGVSNATPKMNSLQSLWGQNFMQGRSGACTAASTNKAMRLSLQRPGYVPLPFADFSPDFTYKATRGVARSLAFPVSPPAFTDSGANPEDCIVSTTNWGGVAMGPLSPDGRYFDVWTAGDTSAVPPNVNHELDPLAIERGQMRLAPGGYDIDFTGSSAAEEMTAANTAGMGQTAALFVDSGVLNWDPNTGPITKIDTTDPKGGGHQVGVTYFYTSTSLGLIIGFGNSWDLPGYSWGISGFGEITLSCLQKAGDAVIVYDCRALDQVDANA
jgi:hypothetical protein